VIADNKLAERAGWDRHILAAELGALKADAFDLSKLGPTTPTTRTRRVSMRRRVLLAGHVGGQDRR
jgi:hypothetical protein